MYELQVYNIIGAKLLYTAVVGIRTVVNISKILKKIEIFKKFQKNE